jgi:hypothetical protein
MISPNDLRKFARECMEAAENSNDPTFKQKMVDMAKQWMNTALETERSMTLPDEPRTPIGDAKA